MSNVIVLGSINVDMVMETDRFPRIGETILGDSLHYFMGGKGANQAVACSRSGADVTIFANVGDDAFGEKALEHLKKEKIHTDCISVIKNTPTGVASIFHIHSDNAIVVLPGANMLLKQADKIQDIISEKDVFLTQLEIPLETVKEGLEFAKKKKARTILNPAPFDAQILKWLDFIDVITPNETEFEGLAGHPIAKSELESEMLKWTAEHPVQLVVTRGADGVSYVENQTVITIPSVPVDVVDTTGAGDTFNGVLAALMAEEMNWHEAVRLASVCASVSTTKTGAQTGMPYREQWKDLP